MYTQSYTYIHKKKRIGEGCNQKKRKIGLEEGASGPISMAIAAALRTIKSSFFFLMKLESHESMMDKSQ